jgi:hypothetical protein
MVVENVIVAAVMVFSATLSFIALLAWRRTRDAQVIFLSIAFGFFFVKALVLSAALFVTTVDLPMLIILWGGFDLLILVLFYGFTLRR